MKRYITVIVLLVSVLSGAWAQTDRDLIRQGNKLYAARKYAEAEVAYRKAIAQNPQNPRALYNLGCVLQKENRDSDAVKQYEQAVKLEPNKTVKSQSYYNMGVVYQTKKDFANAIEAYKNCLRLNPADNDARYNYVLCKRQQQQQQQNGGSNNKDNNDKNNKNNSKNSKKEEKKDSDQNKENSKQQSDKGDQQNGEMSKDNAEQLLQAAMNEENETEAKLKKAMQQPSRRQLDKNW